MDGREDLIAGPDGMMALQKETFTSSIEGYQGQGLDFDQAWAAVKYELYAHLNKLPLPKDWHKNRVVTPEMELRMATILDNDLRPQADPPAASSSQQSDSDGPTGLPSLKGKGDSVIVALASGESTWEGEHPDSTLLREAAIRAVGPHAKLGLNLVSSVNGQQLLFPHQRNKQRKMPADFTQTSLFHVASNNTPRRFLRDELLGRIGTKVEMYYHGEELRHDDEAVFLQLLHIARNRAPYEPITFNNVSFIKDARNARRILGVKDTQPVEDALLRMRGAFVLVRNARRKTYVTINLIKDISAQGVYRTVIIDPGIIVLHDAYASMDEEVLYRLKHVPKQIYKYLSAQPHEQIFPIKVTSFFEHCYGTIEALTAHYKQTHPDHDDRDARAAMTKKLSDFRRKTLPNGLQVLKDGGHILDFKIDEVEGKVLITKRPPDAEEEEGA
jgi:hypothetical protein